MDLFDTYDIKSKFILLTEVYQKEIILPKIRGWIFFFYQRQLRMKINNVAINFILESFTFQI